MCNCNKPKVELSEEEMQEKAAAKAAREIELQEMRANYEAMKQENPDISAELEQAGICVWCGHAKTMCICPDRPM